MGSLIHTHRESSAPRGEAHYLPCDLVTNCLCIKPVLVLQELLINKVRISYKFLLILQNTCNPGYSQSKIPLYLDLTV